MCLLQSLQDEAVFDMFALRNFFIMLRHLCIILLNVVSSLAVYIFSTGILSMVPFGNASVPSCTLYDCATKLFYYAKKHMYNCIECCFKPGGV
jgi:hypothetical protein